MWLSARSACLRYRVGDELLDRDRGIDDAIDERGVGAVLEESPDEIGEQRLVRSDRRVDTAGAVQLVLADDLVVDALAHPVQTLEFVIGRARQRVDRGDGESVVAREL